MRLIDADAIRQVLEVFTEKDTLGHTPLQLCDAMPTASPWHRVDDGLPNEFDTVIVCGRMKYDHEKDYGVFVDAAEYGPYSHDRWVTWNDWYEGQEEFKITHWMPLPEPPKEEYNA